MKNKTTLWLIVAIVIIGSVFGIVKLASISKTGASNLTASAISDNENIKGDKDAKATLIEYSDFQCPACGAYQPILKKVTDNLSAQVRFAYRHFPLPQHKNAKLASTVAEASGKQGKFWEMHDLIFQNQSDWSEE
ncbi:MAG: thioredoxin domain-containing protein, partial [Patescibacteria group bacterium]